jgi:hypothetical protein
LLKTVKEPSEEEFSPNENVCCLNSIFGVKMNASTHTANTALSSTTGRKSAADEQQLEQSKEDCSPEMLLNDESMMKPKSLEEDGSHLLHLYEGRSNKSKSDKLTKPAQE